MPLHSVTTTSSVTIPPVTTVSREAAAPTGTLVRVSTAVGYMFAMMGERVPHEESVPRPPLIRTGASYRLAELERDARIRNIQEEADYRSIDQQRLSELNSMPSCCIIS